MKRIFQVTMMLLFAAIIFFECSQAESKTTPNEINSNTKTVEVIAAKAIDYREEVFATGKVASSEEVKLSFKTGGIIKRIYVAEGQQVKAGQVLAELDLQEISAQVQQAKLGVTASEITIKNAELAIERAERELKNVQGLYQDSVATYEQLHDAELQLQNAKNQLEAAKTGLDVSSQNQSIANFNLKYSKIIAPSNGTILKKLAESSELIGMGMPVFLFGTKDKAKVIRVNVTDKDIIFVKLGDEAVIEFDPFPNKIFKGKVVEVASMADPYTNTFEVEVQIEPDGKQLLSGFIGTVNILTSQTKKLLEIPIDALVKANRNTALVYIVKSGQAFEQEIQVYKIENGKLLIERSLEEGAKVIIAGAGYLENEDSVHVK